MTSPILARFCGTVILFLVCCAAGSCGRSSATAANPRIALNPSLQTIDITGLPADALRELASSTRPIEEWQALLRVSVKASGPGPAIAGSYAVAGDVLRFTPMFPFDEGRDYEASLDPAKLPGSRDGRGTERIVAVVGRPASERVPSAVVTRIYPSGTELPANQLRMYLHFSAPMDWRSGYDHLLLLDERGAEVVDAFLPLDADFWNDDRTRYTVFFDPGRVKRGILPNRQMGRALEAGKRYTLVVKREWRDGHGLPLKEEFRHEFRAVPPMERALTMASWRVSAPRAGTRDALAVVFPHPLDHGLLRRALGVTRDGKPIEGGIDIDEAETRWKFTPRDAWVPGDYQLVALEFLEDLAGNRVGRAFEVDNFNRTDITSEPARSLLPFRVAAPTTASR